MPQELNWSAYTFGTWNEAQLENSEKKGPKSFPLLPGRALYERVAIGSANVGPVNKLLAFTVMDAEAEWPSTALGVRDDFDARPGDDPEAHAPFTLYEIAERHIVEGPMVAYFGPDGVQWLDWLIEVTDDLVLQRVDPIGQNNINGFYDYEKDPKAVIRVYERQLEVADGAGGEKVVTGSYWSVKDVRYVHGEMQPYTPTSGSPIPPKPARIDADLFYPFPFGPSVEYRAGRTIQRLLEIAADLRVESYAQRMKTLSRAGGSSSGTAKKVAAAQADGDRVLSLPEGYSLTSQSDATPANMLMQEKAELQRDLAAITNTVDLDESSNKSGKARMIEMQPMLNAVRRYRRNIDQIYSVFGAKVAWPPIMLAEVTELLASLDLNTKMYDAGSIGRAEYDTLNRDLIGLDGPPPDDIKDAAPDEPEDDIANAIPPEFGMAVNNPLGAEPPPVDPSEK